MDQIQSGWFSELNDLWAGQSLSLQVEKVLHHEKSKYQDILVFQSKTYGRVLALDGVIQCTERDEFAYQEMMAHLPLFSHHNPKSVLVIGGGDGGVLREVAKHSTVETISICEIDERVIEVSKEYLPTMAIGYKDPRVKVHVQDGAEFLVDHKESFDVIITDSSDPIGPAKCLFEKSYFEKLREALRSDGILCSQGECIWLDLSLIKSVLDNCRALFPVAGYASITIPTYPCGQIGMVMATRNKELVLSEPTRTLTEEEVEQLQLQYYNTDIHRAAFTLPQFVKKALRV